MASKRWSLWFPSGSLELDIVRLSSSGKGKQLPETMLYLLLAEYLQTSYLAFLSQNFFIHKMMKRMIIVLKILLLFLLHLLK